MKEEKEPGLGFCLLCLLAFAIFVFLIGGAFFYVINQGQTQDTCNQPSPCYMQP